MLDNKRQLWHLGVGWLSATEKIDPRWSEGRSFPPKVVEGQQDPDGDFQIGGMEIQMTGVVL